MNIPDRVIWNSKASLLWVIILIFNINITAQSYKHIPPYHPVYDDILFLQSQGFLLSLNMSSLPVTENSVLEAISKDLRSEKIESADASSLHLIVRIVEELADNPEEFLKNQKISSPFLQKIRKMIRKIIVQQENNEKLHLGFINEDEFGTNKQESDFNFLLRTRAGWETGSIYIYNGMVIDPYAPKNPHYIGKEWRGLAGYTEEAYFCYRSESGRTGIDFGRFYQTWGPGLTGKLHLSSASRPMDMVRFQLGGGMLRFSGFTARLDMMANNNRYLSGHRLDFIPTNNLILGVNESILYGGENQNFELAYLNPFIFFHGIQMNGPGMLGNTIGSIDFSFFTKWGHFYGALMIDDIQLDKKEVGDLEPNEIGWLIGAEKGEPWGIPSFRAGIEYSAITNRTYKTPNDYEIFTHRGIPLGYYLGNDFDHLYIWMEKYFTENWKAKLAVFSIRKGEGDLYAPWDSPWTEFTVEEGYSEPFPTGVVEHHFGFRGELRFEPSYRTQFYLSFTTESVNNYDHIKGKKDNSWEIKLGVWLDFYKSVKLTGF